ncbi:MAG: excinuclease ABC subunit UvrA [Peptostreptococcaceae bacterium]
MIKNTIEILGAKENNLKNINISIPKYKLVAITGPSGSGKSTLAMDILQRECQRQYMESLGMLADGLNKPNVDKSIGLSPSISVSQRAIGANSKSTVGTYTEILTFLRILYAKLGIRKCSHCGESINPSFENEAEIDKKKITCPHCKKKLDSLSMANFSFNKPEGACKICSGFGVITDIDLSKVVNENLSVAEGAFILWQGDVFGGHYRDVLKNCAKHYGFEFDADKKVKDYNELEKLVFYKGVDSEEFKMLFPKIKKPKKVMDGYFKGVYTFMKEKADLSNSKELQNEKITNAFTKITCPDCNGSRLNEESRNVTIKNISIGELIKYDLETLEKWINELYVNLENSSKQILKPIINDLLGRTKNIIKIGLAYLSIDREVSTLSGGEAQRLKLSNIIDSSLTGVIYILDEPTTGLHPKDVSKLLDAVKVLRDLGNTVIVIEHDTDFINECDYIIDFGPGAGVNGGNIVAHGSIKDIINNPSSITGKYLRNNNITLKDKAIDMNNNIHVKNAHANNLKNIDVKIPLNEFVCFSGVSGSGKSSLVFDVISKYIEEGKSLCDAIEGIDKVDSIITINQKPIGRQSRSNIATYTDTFTLIRELYANLELSKKKKLKNSDFSFNVSGGRCENCQGLGTISLNMQFMDDVEVICPVCNGHRFKKKILEVKYDNKNISDILNMTVDEAIEVFENNKEINHKLKNLNEVGLGYLKLGQSTTTLSGGECQRLKLSKELGKTNKGHILYILDEPTTGLHPKDIEKILSLLNKLKEKGNSIFVIEHALEVITYADYIIDLGVYGGCMGGNIVAYGTPKQIIENKDSYTAKYIKEYIRK